MGVGDAARRIGQGLVLGVNASVPQRLRGLGRRVRRIFRKAERRPVYEPDKSRLAELVSHVPGASFVWCGGCGSMMHPVVLGDDDHTRVVALGCDCGIGIPVRAGLLIGGELAATVH
jgi:hypothetical protein